jgi:ABC-type thiamine transport system substrate-binding protein
VANFDHWEAGIVVFRETMLASNPGRAFRLAGVSSARQLAYLLTLQKDGADIELIKCWNTTWRTFQQGRRLIISGDFQRICCSDDDHV